MKMNRGPASLNRWPAVIAVSIALITSVVAVGCSKVADEAGGNKAGAETGVEAVAEVSDAGAAEASAQAAGAESSASGDETGKTSTDQKSDSTDSASAGISFEQVDKSELSAGNAIQSQGGSLPAYEYPGPELFYSVVYDYIANVIGKGYLPGDVTIPCPIIVDEDDSNKSDILLYGNFCVYNYTLSQDGTTLMTVSGGSHPGCMHIALKDVGGYEVTGFDAVGDGSDFEPTAKKIFGSYYDAFKKVYSDDKLHEETRAQIISNYAAANNLPITGYQDYGWEKKALPTENIDSFYSDL